MAPPVVDVRGLTKTYQTRRGPIAAVDGIDLEVGAGEFVAICGRSGSGKSTLLGLLGGLCRPTAGAVRIDGVDLGSLDANALAALRARRIGFLFQFAGLLPNLRAVDNVALPALLGGMDDRQAVELARDWLGRVGLAERWDAYGSELSGGQQRRVALARALINRPALLLADEPTSDLDEEAEQEVLDLLHRLHEAENTTLIVVTHDPGLAGQADWVIRLRGGRLVAPGVLDSRGIPAAAIMHPVSTLPELSAAVDAFEPAPLGLVASEPTPLGAGLGRFLAGFVGWTLVVACGLYAMNAATSRVQRRTIEAKADQRKKAEELALQQLRADVGDVTSEPGAGGDFTLSVFLENFHPEKPIHVLGPKLRVFVQVNQAWQPIPLASDAGSENAVHAITARQTFPVKFHAELDRFDELIMGYMHVRISSMMIVSPTAEPIADLFERNDDYYLYLKPQNISDDEVRRRNGWKPGALVPRWIAMPAH